MSMLVADRFLCRMGRAPRGRQLSPATLVPGVSLAAIDLATGERVRLRIDEAGTHADQQAWVESCARARHDGPLVDFGFIFKDRRFEAMSTSRRNALPPPVPAPLADWLEAGRPSSARILYLPDLPDARDLRLRGFVPIDLCLLSEASRVEIGPLVAGRSIVLLDSRCAPSHLALALLKLRRAHVREVCALSRRADCGRALVGNAAERRPAYEPVPMAIGNARAGGMLADGERLLAAGRHAAAERTLRAALAAFDRRGDAFHAGDAAMMLGRLLLTRGRAADAGSVFEGAHDQFQRARAPIPALIATIQLGMAQVDLGLLSEAERSCRAAYAAAAAVSSPEVAALAGTGLVRTLLSQERCADARAVLESIAPASDPEACARVLVSCGETPDGGGQSHRRPAGARTRAAGQPRILAGDRVSRPQVGGRGAGPSWGSRGARDSREGWAGRGASGASAAECAQVEAHVHRRTPRCGQSGTRPPRGVPPARALPVVDSTAAETARGHRAGTNERRSEATRRAGAVELGSRGRGDFSLRQRRRHRRRARWTERPAVALSPTGRRDRGAHAHGGFHPEAHARHRRGDVWLCQGSGAPAAIGGFGKLDDRAPVARCGDGCWP